MSNYSVTVSNNTIKVDASTVSHSISLARTGGQGSKGDSVTGAAFNENNELIITITDSAGNTSEVNAGDVTANFSVDDLSDTEITAVADGQVLQFNATTQKYENHTLTTANIESFDITNEEDGAIFVYDASTQKYVATNRIEQETTNIIGGTF